MRSSESCDSCWLATVRARRALALEWTRGRCVWDRSWTRGRESMARECASRRGRPTWCPRRTGGLGSRGNRLRLRPTVVLGLWSIAFFSFVINRLYSSLRRCLHWNQMGQYNLTDFSQFKSIFSQMNLNWRCKWKYIHWMMIWLIIWTFFIQISSSSMKKSAILESNHNSTNIHFSFTNSHSCDWLDLWMVIFISQIVWLGLMFLLIVVQFEYRFKVRKWVKLYLNQCY